MTPRKDILDALYTAVEQLGVVVGMAYELPDQTFTPADDAADYLQIRHFPNDTLSYSLDNSVSVQLGILQIGVVTHSHAGETANSVTCDRIAAFFAKGTEFRSGQAVVKIEAEPSVLGMVQDGHRSIYPVSVRYRCST